MSKKGEKVHYTQRQRERVRIAGKMKNENLMTWYLGTPVAQINDSPFFVNQHLQLTRSYGV